MMCTHAQTYTPNLKKTKYKTGDLLPNISQLIALKLYLVMPCWTGMSADIRIMYAMVMVCFSWGKGSKNRTGEGGVGLHLWVIECIMNTLCMSICMHRCVWVYIYYMCVGGGGYCVHLHVHVHMHLQICVFLFFLCACTCIWKAGWCLIYFNLTWASTEMKSTSWSNCFACACDFPVF